MFLTRVLLPVTIKKCQCYLKSISESMIQSQKDSENILLNNIFFAAITSLYHMYTFLVIVSQLSYTVFIVLKYYR